MGNRIAADLHLAAPFRFGQRQRIGPAGLTAIWSTQPQSEPLLTLTSLE